MWPSVDANVQQPVRGHRLTLSLELERCQRLHGHRVAHQSPRLRTDDDLPRRSSLLEARGDVDGVPGREAFLGSGDDRTSVHAGAHRDRGSVVACELAVQVGEGITQSDSRADGAQRIILVQNGHAEHRHDRIADELLHGPAMLLDDLSRGVEVAAHHLAEALRVQPLPHRGRSRDVAEEHRDGLALCPRRLCRCQR